MCSVPQQKQTQSGNQMELVLRTHVFENCKFNKERMKRIESNSSSIYKYMLYLGAGIVVKF